VVDSSDFLASSDSSLDLFWGDMPIDHISPRIFVSAEKRIAVLSILSLCTGIIFQNAGINSEGFCTIDN
jgi:hypothetical protein